jgi:hypothetical protein
MSRMRRRAGPIAVLVISAAVLASCGVFDRGKKTTATTVPPTTTTTKFIVIAVAPEAGPIGTTFNLVGVGFSPGDDVTFVVEFPNGNRFPGQPHVVAGNTTVIANYRATPGNPVGDYVVRATSTRGESSAGKFTVLGPGGAPPTTAAGGATTPTTASGLTTSSTRASRTTTTTHR